MSSAKHFLIVLFSFVLVLTADAQNKPIFKAKDKVTADIRLMGKNGPPELAYDNITYELTGDFLDDTSTYLIKTVKHYRHYNNFMEGGTKCDSVTLVFYPNCSKKGAFQHTAKCDEFYYESYRRYLIALSHGCCAEPTRGVLSTWKENRPFLQFDNDYFEISRNNDYYYVGVVNHYYQYFQAKDTTAGNVRVATIYYSHNQQPADSIVVTLRKESGKEYCCPETFLKRSDSTECFGEDPIRCRNEINHSKYCKYDGLIFSFIVFDEYTRNVKIIRQILPFGLNQKLPKEIIINDREILQVLY